MNNRFDSCFKVKEDLVVEFSAVVTTCGLVHLDINIIRNIPRTCLCLVLFVSIDDKHFLFDKCLERMQKETASNYL